MKAKLFLLSAIAVLGTCSLQAQCSSDYTYVTSPNGDVTFTNTSTGYTNPGFVWIYGDGNYGSGPTSVYNYQTGNYCVCLQTYDLNCSDTTCHYISVVNTTGIAPGNSTSAIKLRCYPNPSGAATTISYSLHSEAQVVLTITDVLGNTVAVLEDSEKSAGDYQLPWNTEAVAEGVYFIVLYVDNSASTSKIIVTK